MVLTLVGLDPILELPEHFEHEEFMGWLLIVSIAAMTSVMTMLQLVVLALTLTPSPAVQASGGSQRTESASVKSYSKKNGKVVSRRSATRGTRHDASHQKR